MSVSAFSKRSLPSRSETSREPLKAGQPRQSSKENPTPRSMNSTAKRMANETPKRAVISAAKSSAVRGPSQATRPPISKPVNASEEGEDPDPELEKRKVSNSSSALRETIARAKAARRELVARQTSTGEKKNNASKSSQVNAANSFAAESIVDDFEPGMLQDEHVNFLKKRVNAARTDGRLNISGMGLKAIPSEVIHMYDMDSVEAAGGSWYECVDLVRFIAADNEISEIEDHLFPDKQLSSAEFNEDEDHGNQFGGLELLDLHGNLLTSIPPGLRRLERLVTLNLSNNKLGQEALDIISEIESLQVLKLANNNLEGELEPSISRLKKLEVLDLRGNSITSLPRSLADLAELRNLNVSENRICSLPIDSLVSLPIRELVLSKNNLSGILFGRSVVSWSSLQFLDISNNNLVELSEEEEFHLPLLHTLALSFNSITSLPNISSWAELVTLTAEDNKLSSIPQGLSSLSKLKSADFTGNNIVTLDEHIGRMDSLDVLRVAGNPLRERKFLNMSTDQLKRDLASRLDPEPVDGSDAFDSEVPNPTTGYSSAKHPSSASLSKWPVQTDGKLDLSSKTLDDSNIHSIPFEELAISEYTIRNLLLSQNRLSLIPMSCLSIVSHSLVNLDLSHNSLKGSSYLPLSSPSPSSSSSPSSPSSSTAPSTSLPLTLPKLKSLSLAFNSITSLAPLQSSLQAPLLEYLNVSTNRITSLPVLRSTFPSLTTLLASENCIQDLTYEAVEGLAVVNLASNDIGSLPPRMGLLKGSLKSLDVKGNRFRVPKYTVLEKGTEATLDWLRGRIPADDDAEEVF
ncbi:L domain-like protein [Xylona heveae TC161]|uniref:L domain-like protein n=1 Tax=Xylona heveae (strain CBS 132557 / TC161) TaxID=1328760 RepID=A0A165GZK9_XYLHT|nr:L domain-like protein [Xylona heveae TC161]KZF22801.1 L domain-like protein [Xylona heveae TC161]